MTHQEGEVSGLFDKHRIEKACEDETFQAALQRYAHANGSSLAIMQAAAKALDAVSSSPSDSPVGEHPTGEDSGIVIDTLGGNCPVQAEGRIDGEPFYFRARGESWSLGIGGDPVSAPTWEHCEEWGDSAFAAGWMEEAEAYRMIAKGAAMYRKAVAP